MKTVVDGNLVLIDDTIAVEKDRGKYKTYVANDKFKDVLVYDTSSDQPIRLQQNNALPITPKVEYDPKYYTTSVNNLTLEESVDRAYRKIVANNFNGDRSYTEDVKEGIRHLIKTGQGRDAAYKLAAQCKEACKKGIYGKVSVMQVFRLAALMKIGSPEFALKYDSLPSKPEPKTEYDPVYYYSGRNGLTVQQSADRATAEALYILGMYYASPAERKLVYEGAEKMIREGKGRQSVYKLAGGVKKGFYNGEYKGVSRAIVFNSIAQGLAPQPVA